VTGTEVVKTSKNGTLGYKKISTLLVFLIDLKNEKGSGVPVIHKYTMVGMQHLPNAACLDLFSLWSFTSTKMRDRLAIILSGGGG
jgi:hypothetical protein